MLFSRPLRTLPLLAAAGLLALLPAPAHAKARAKAPVEAGPAYKGAIIMDAATGSVLLEDHDGESSPPASMTKLMTFAVIHDKLQSGALTLQTPVTVVAADSKIGGTQVWLKEGEVFTVEELLYAMMIQSANDAAYALARTAAGAVPAFVDLMNAKARELGMTHSTFRTPHGLPPSNRRLSEGDLTTPHDFALLCRHLLLKTDIIKYTSVKRRAFGPPARGTMMDNHDHLLGRVQGVDGLKTGFTNGAGFCLSATALRNGRRIIVVVMGSPDSKTRDLKVAELIERGFTTLPPNGPAFASTGAASSADPSPISAAPVPAADKPAATEDGSPSIKFSLPTVPGKK
ncbi:MAG TPA: D-alanyl-D-alanine carboxypeptidase family protein, partial [Opitutaceae bacterium]|nr:D-alanyl-D-alanine carboxypeptidase family protein [Opitutaceae bacterium]HND60088.1 D-alanyl-D-alanine carboxypeptidase family protein [Opitutaceae bacterium]